MKTTFTANHRKRVRTRAGLALAAITLATTACDFINGPDGYDGDIVFTVLEMHGLNDDIIRPPFITLQLVTRKGYLCANYGLQVDISRDGAAIHVDVGNELVPYVCYGGYQGVYPAIHRTPLKLEDGAYDLTFTSSAGTARYNLTITADALQVESRDGAHFEARYDLVLRYPPRSFVITCDEGTATGLCDDMVALLDAEAAIHPFTFPDSGIIPYDEAYGLDPAWFFRYDSATDFNTVETLFADFVAERDPTNSGAIVAIRNWVNQSLSSR